MICIKWREAVIFSSRSVTDKMGLRWFGVALSIVVFFLIEKAKTKTLFEGDIANITGASTIKLWKDEKIPYMFKGSFSNPEKKVIKDALDYISDNVKCIQFR